MNYCTGRISLQFFVIILLSTDFQVVLPTFCHHSALLSNVSTGNTYPYYHNEDPTNLSSSPAMSRGRKRRMMMNIYHQEVDTISFQDSSLSIHTSKHQHDNLEKNFRSGNHSKTLSFIVEPPYQIFFINSEGIQVPCRAATSYGDVAKIQWFTVDNDKVEDIPDIRYVRSDGMLIFPPFVSGSFDSRIHRNTYFCIASDEFGSISSRNTRIHGVIHRNPIIHVHDQYAIPGNTVSFICHISGYQNELMKVIEWIEEPTGRIIKPLMLTGSASTLDSSNLIGVDNNNNDINNNADVASQNEQSKWWTSLDKSRYWLNDQGILYLRKVDSSLKDHRYRCRATCILNGQVFTSSSSGRLILRGLGDSFSPRIKLKGPDHYVAHLGGKIIFTCPVVNSLPVSYSWFRKTFDNQRGIQYMDEINEVFGRYKVMDEFLLINKIQSDDAGTYICRANNSIEHDEVSIKLAVKSPLKIRLIRHQAGASWNTSHHHVTGTILLNCLISGEPVSSIVWKKNGKSLDSSISGIKFINQSTLEINEYIGTNERGYYQCFASNDYESVSKTIYIGPSAIKIKIITPSGSRLTFYTPEQSMNIVCKIRGKPLPRIHWTLDGSIISNSSHHRITTTRVNHKDNLMVSSLNITKIGLLDAGLYQCATGYGVHKVFDWIKVVVRGPLLVKSMQNLTLLVNDHAQIDCPVVGWPIDSIVWLKDGEGLKWNTRRLVDGNGSLIIQKADKSLDEGRYTCIAKQGEHKSESSFSISVRIKPIIEPFMFLDGLQVGQRASLPCTVATGDYPINIQWLKDGEPVRHGPNPKVLKVSDYSISLIFESLIPSHRGNYTCEAKNQAGYASYSTTLDINEAPRWLLEPSDSWSVRGNKVVLHCQATGHPQPRIRWSKSKNDSITSFKGIISNPHMQVHENGSLIINESGPNDLGYYLCQAHNGVGSGMSKIIKLDIFVNAHFSSHHEEKRVVINHSVTLECNASGEEPLELVWIREGRKLASNTDAGPDRRESNLFQHRYIISEEHQNMMLNSRLTIEVARPQDSALFICRTSNPFGSDEKKIFLIVQESPSQPINLIASEISAHSIKLRWIAPSDGHSPITNFLLEYNTQSPRSSDHLVSSSTNHQIQPSTTTHKTMLIPGNQTNVTVNNLRPFSAYYFRVIAENSIGRSHPSNTQTVVTAEKKPSEPPQLVKVSALSSSSVKVSWSPPPSDHVNGLIRGYQVTYQLIESDSGTLNPIELVNISKSDQYEVIIDGLSRLSRYAFKVSAYNGKGLSPESDAFFVTTMGIDLPNKPTLNVVYVSANSVHLSWTLAADLNHPVEGFNVYQRSDDHENSLKILKTEKTQQKAVINGQRRFYKTDNLECATRYYYSVSAFNTMGEGPTSDVISILTNGSAPITPEFDHAIRLINNFRELLINVDEWEKNGCQLLEFSISCLVFSGHHSRWTPFTSASLSVGHKNITIPIKDREKIEKVQITARNRLGTSKTEYILPQSRHQKNLTVKLSSLTSGDLSLITKARPSKSGEPIENREFNSTSYIAWITMAWFLPSIAFILLKYLKNSRIRRMNLNNAANFQQAPARRYQTENLYRGEEILVPEEGKTSPIENDVATSIKLLENEPVYSTLIKKTKSRSNSLADEYVYLRANCCPRPFDTWPDRHIDL
ncbi:cell adhesion molecule DSCAM-like [Brevipalpus obovatus]|uniref:cell adhesion molecule DSCAM-like n=1 Tax=Brevipalpus obovatus TaxID=246614 RepID=UPI003D9EA4F6